MKRIRVPAPEWIVVADHHEPYITPAHARAIDALLAGNRISTRQPAGTGPALCQGLIVCGRCGRAMAAICGRKHLKRGGSGYTYVCYFAHNQLGEAPCWTVNGPPVDAVMTQELLGHLTPPAIEAVLAAVTDINADYEAARHQRRIEVERAQYDVDIAKRRYEAVDPANDLVRATVEGEYQRAMIRAREIARAHGTAPLTPPVAPDDATLAAIRQLAVRIPEVWAAPSTTDQDRKLVVRLFVQEVRVTAVSEVQFAFVITWIGGAVTRHCVYRHRAPGVLARDLRAQGRGVAAIATELNQRGLRTRLRGNPYTAEGVQRLLRGRAPADKSSREPWRSFREPLREPVTAMFTAGLPDEAIAAELNRRGFRPFRPGVWSAIRVLHLRKLFGLRRPTTRDPDPRITNGIAGADAGGGAAADPDV